MGLFEKLGHEDKRPARTKMTWGSSATDQFAANVKRAKELGHGIDAKKKKVAHKMADHVMGDKQYSYDRKGGKAVGFTQNS